VARRRLVCLGRCPALSRRDYGFRPLLSAARHRIQAATAPDNGVMLGPDASQAETVSVSVSVSVSSTSLILLVSSLMPGPIVVEIVADLR